MIRGLRQQNRDQGSVALEFALSVITILLVMFLIVDVGRALYAYDWISDAARQATRFAMVRGKTCDPLLNNYCQVGSQPRGAQSQDITNYVNSLAVGVGPFTTGSSTSPCALNANCVNSTCYVGSNIARPLPCTATTWVQVQVVYNFSFVSPFIPLSWSMQSTSERTVQQ